MQNKGFEDIDYEDRFRVMPEDDIFNSELQ